MQRINVSVTIALGAAAALCWVRVVSPTVLPGLGYPDPRIYIPLACALTFAACVGWLVVGLSGRRRDGETRCRRCGYILRGISEPRCPECGERI
jgi:hypothetical protein